MLFREEVFMKVNPHRSSLGMDANVMALICYLAAFVLAWIPIVQYVAWAAPLVIFFIEKESPFVKFHAIQALILEAISWVFTVIFGIIIAASWRSYVYGYGLAGVGILGVLGTIISIIITVFAIIAMVKAYGYFEYKIPVVGNLAEKFSKKTNIPH